MTTSLMPAFGEWLKTTRLIEFSVWIGNTRLSNFLNQNSWITPTLQSIHILAIACTFSAVLMICLRVVGVGVQGRTLLDIEKRYVPWIWGGLLVLLTTGTILLLAEPSRQLLNPYFWTKMGLVVAVTLVTLGFQTSVQRDAVIWRSTGAANGALRTGALVVTVAWATIMVLGRWIAYGV
ncbi:MAG: hypothetical protein WDN45_16345 [Caulobacteraceae bacterium]